MKNYRNGDWTFVQIEQTNITNPLKHNGTFTFAEGEATGHFHRIVADKPEDLVIEKTATGDYVFVLKSKARVTHPEHSMKTDLIIEPGTYKLMQRREKDWFQNVVRKVID